MTGYHEIPFRVEDEPIDYIIEMMALADPPHDLDPDAVRLLVREARYINRMVLSDWLRRNEPGWQPKKRQQDNWPKDEPSYDYGTDAGVGLDDHRYVDPATGKEYRGWDGWWREHWGRGRKNPGRFRDGSDIPKPPLVAIYFLVNKWWRHVVGKRFWCDFRALHLGDDYTGMEKLEFINDSALFFVLIAKSVDEYNYTPARCKSVHDQYYKKLDRTMP